MTRDTRWLDDLNDLTHDALAAFGRQAMARVESGLETRTAAPEATGAAAGANGWKEPMDMHDLIEERGHRGRQFQAAFALAHLLEVGLPDVVSWQISDYHPQDVRGLLNVKNIGQAERRDLLTEWAEFLRAPVLEDRGAGGLAAAELYVQASYKGVTVRIFCPEVDVCQRKGGRS